MTYVIKNGSFYVSKRGSASSYTNKLQNAQVFKTREEAEKNKCENEGVVYVELQPNKGA